VSSFTGTWTRQKGNYTAYATFDATADARYHGSTSATLPFRVFEFITYLQLQPSGGHYRGAVVVKATMRYCCLFGSVRLAKGKTVKFYRMATPTTRSLAGATLIGTAITGNDGVASVLYKMNIPSPPAPQTNLGFAAVFEGDAVWGGSQSPTVARQVVKRPVTNTLAAQKAGNTLTGTVTVKEANVSYTTVSNNVATTTTLGGAGVTGTPVVLNWLNSAGAVIGSFTVTTGAGGVAAINRTIPQGAVRVRAVSADTNRHLSKASNTITF
jgi:hypothetical protein